MFHFGMEFILRFYPAFFTEYHLNGCFYLIRRLLSSSNMQRGIFFIWLFADRDFINKLVDVN